MKRATKILFFLVLPVTLLVGIFLVSFFWDRLKDLMTPEEELLAAWLKNVKQELQAKPELKDVRLYAKCIDGRITLIGVVKRPNHKADIQSIATKVLEDFPGRLCGGPISPDGIKVAISVRLQQEFAESSETLKRLTRIDSDEFDADGKRVFTCLCLEADAKKRLREAIKLELEKSGETSDVDVTVVNHDYPVGLLQKRLDERVKGVTLVAAWYRGDGKLHLEGVITNETERDKAEKEVAALLQAEGLKPLWDSPNKDAVGHAFKPSLFDADATITNLRKKLHKEATQKEWTRMLHVHLQAVTLAKKDLAPKPVQPRYEFKLENNFLDTSSKFTVAEAEIELRRWLQNQLPQLVDVDNSTIAPRPELTPLGMKLETFQQRLVKAKLDGAVFTDLRFDDVGRLELHGRQHEPDAKARQEMQKAVLEPLGKERQSAKFDTITPHLTPDGRPIAWKDLLQDVRSRLAASKGVGKRSRLDRLYFGYEKDKLVLDGNAVVMLDGDARLKLHELLENVTTIPAKTEEAARLWKEIPYPLANMQQHIAKDKTLDGTLVRELYYDAAGALRVKGFLGDPKQKETLEKLLPDWCTDTKDLLKGKEKEAWSLELKSHQAPLGKDQTWSQILGALRLAAFQDVDLRHQWLERALFLYRDQPRKLVLQWQAKRLMNPADVKDDPKLAAKVRKLCEQALPGVEFDRIEPVYDEIETPIFQLQKMAVAKGYAGVLFEDAFFDPAGRLCFKGYLGDPSKQKLLQADIATELGATLERIAPAGLCLLNLERLAWPLMLSEIRRSFAESSAPLLRQTRIDDFYFDYQDPKSKPRLVAKGVCVFQSESTPQDKQEKKFTEALKLHLKVAGLAGYELAFDGIDRKIRNPAVELQSQAIARNLDGVAFRAAGFDVKGVLFIDAHIPKGQDEAVSTLFKKLKMKHANVPIEPSPWVDDFVRAPDKKALPQVDWPNLLADLRKRFAGSTEPTLQQTRIDRAYFTLHPKEPDERPFLNFKGVCLLGANDAEAQVKKLLKKELENRVRGVKYEVELEHKEDNVAFAESPIYVLQKAAVAARKTDPTLNVFFERATYAADGVLQLHVLFLEDAPAAKIEKIYDKRIAPELLKLPGSNAKAPTVLPRAYDWPAKLKELRRQLADDSDPLMQRTRLDTGFLAYSDDKKSVLFHVDGLCVHPSDLVTAAERVKRWSKPLGNLIPIGEPGYVPAVDGIVMHANPSIAWQDEATCKEAHDGIFFHLAQFDGVGALKAVVMLPTEAERAAALQIVAEKPAPAKLGAVGEKTFDFQVWHWKDVLPKAQTRLARGDFLEHRTRLDRIFLKYDGVKLGMPFMHFEGVSLHPTEVEKVKDLRSRLERLLGDLPPCPLKHELHSERIQFVTSPIYALQNQAVEKKLDGLLFADGRYDADGKLHIGIVIGAPEQRDIARKMVDDALPMPEGVVRPKAAKDQPLLDYTQIAWAEVLHEMQRWLARSGESLLKKSRLERGFFSYPPSKAGPDLNMALVGIYPKKDALTAKLTKRLDAYVLLSLTDQLRAGTVAVVPTIENIDNPVTPVQAKVHELPVLDGVRLDDASFDGDGKLILYGIWNGKKQQQALDKLMRDTLAEAHPALRRGINWGSLQECDTAGLLHSMRVWVADQEAIDEVWLERIFFDADGKVRVVGFHTRLADKEKSLRTLPEFMPRFDSEALPSIEPAEPKAKEAPKDDPFQLVPLTNIAEYLRNKIPTVTKCDGLRIDRCFYDPQGVFRIEGLADHAAHTKDLKPFLDDETAPFDRARQLAKGWGEGRQTVIALRPMMVSLRENLPSLAEFDGFTLARAHHDPKNHLVLSGNAIGDADEKEMGEILTRLLKTHPRWRLRTTFGVVVKVTDRKKADRELADKLTYKALHLLQVNIGEARIDPLPPSAIGWMSHAWPFDPKLPRVRPTDHDYAMCLEYLDAALLNDTKNVLAWYLRGYVLQTRDRADLTLRDLRRMVEQENENAELRHNRIVALELVQGVWRQSAYRIEQDALIEVGDGWTLRSLRESPVAPDKTK